VALLSQGSLEGFQGARKALEGLPKGTRAALLCDETEVLLVIDTNREAETRSSEDAPGIRPVTRQARCNLHLRVGFLEE